MLGHQHLRQQPGGGDALVDDLGGHARLGQRAAARAGALATDVALDREDTGAVAVVADASGPASPLRSPGRRELGAQRRPLDLAFLNAMEAALTASALMGPVPNWSISSMGIVGSAAAAAMARLVYVGIDAPCGHAMPRIQHSGRAIYRLPHQ